MAFSLLSLLVFSISFLHKPFSSTANFYKSSNFRSPIFPDPPSINAAAPTAFFEVTKPINLPNTKPCSNLILQHSFAYTYGESPVLSNYNPPSDCPSSHFDKIVLEWTATCKGRQFDRIFGVWLGGVELLRSCTAEPKATGIIWTVKKDITRYYSLLMTNQTLAVYLGNVVDDTYTGVYHVNVTFHFYPSENMDELSEGFGDGADLILPISSNLPLNDGLWFQIKNSNDLHGKQIVIPQNTYRAVLEVYVSFHESEEFWYTNLPNEYIEANYLDGTPGNGPFREVLVNLDGNLVGAVWPFTVIFTGGVNPLLWRPITGIGSFDLPSYDIELTPLLEKLLDGKPHKFSFGVTNALNVWYVNANLHLWLDGKSLKTEAKILTHTTLPLRFSNVFSFTGLDGSFLKNVSRSILSSGWVKSSHGKVTTDSKQELGYSNFMVMGNDGNMQTINQVIDMNTSVTTLSPYSIMNHSVKSFKRFPLYLYSDNVDAGKGAYNSVANVTLGFIEKYVKACGNGFSVSNVQNAQGSMLVKGNLVVSGLASTQQLYRYNNDNFCFVRNISSSNYAVLYDEIRHTCPKEGRLYGHEGISVI